MSRADPPVGGFIRNPPLRCEADPPELFIPAKADRLANAIVAVGGPDKRCGACGTNAYALARLTLEVVDQLEDEDVTLAGAHLTAVRGERYGHPSENFARIAALWEPILGVRVTPQQVGLAMIALKLGRLIETPDDPDSIADIAGYAATLDMLAGREPTV